jgi:hypothetical protein
VHETPAVNHEMQNNGHVTAKRYSAAQINAGIPDSKSIPNRTNKLSFSSLVGRTVNQLKFM